MLTRFKKLKDGQKFLHKNGTFIKVKNPEIFGQSDLNAIDLWKGKEIFFSENTKVLTMRLFLLLPLMIFLPGGCLLFFLT